MELEACLPKFHCDTDSPDTGKTDKPDKIRHKLQREELKIPTTSDCESSSPEGPSDKLKTSSSQPKNSSSQQNDHTSAETPSAPPVLESIKDVDNSAELGRLSPVLEQAEEESTVSVTPVLPSIPSNTSVKCVVCEGNAKPPRTEHPEVIKNGTDEGVRLPQIDPELSDEERAEAKLNPGLPRSLLRARIRKRRNSQLPTSNPNNYHVHFPNAERKDIEAGHSNNDGKSRDEKYPLERSVHHLPPIQTDRAYGRRTWPGDAMELVGTNGYTSGIMPKVIQANYNTHLYGRDGQQGRGDSLPTVVRSRALIRREQKKPGKDMYVWLGLDSKYQLRLMTNNPKSVSHTDKS